MGRPAALSPHPPQVLCDSAPARPAQQDFCPLPVPFRQPPTWILARLPAALAQMQGAGALRGQDGSPARMDALRQRWVLPLTYLLASLESTCLFMQFSIIPVSPSSPGSLATSWPPLSLSWSTCAGSRSRAGAPHH